MNRTDQTRTDKYHQENGEKGDCSIVIDRSSSLKAFAISLPHDFAKSSVPQFLKLSSSSGHGVISLSYLNSLKHVLSHLVAASRIIGRFTCHSSPIVVTPTSLFDISRLSNDSSTVDVLL